MGSPEWTFGYFQVLLVHTCVIVILNIHRVSWHLDTWNSNLTKPSEKKNNPKHAEIFRLYIRENKQLVCPVPYQGGDSIGALALGAKFYRQHFQKQEVYLFGNFFQIQKHFAMLNKTLTQCLGFSSLIIDEFAAVKAQKCQFKIFNYILSNKVNGLNLGEWHVWGSWSSRLV